ncbi:MAG: divergent polysaccharide deacetylase family protein [Thermoanaerobaculia bacterium]
MPGREGMARSSFRTIAILTLLPIAGFLGFLLLAFMTRIGPLQLDAARLIPKPLRVEDRRPRLSATPEKTRQAGLPVPSIVIIIDDVGYDGQNLTYAMSIDPNLNFAILPNSTRAPEVARRLNDRGFEILCHLPMEPRDHTFSPGANAVKTSMSDDEIFLATRANIAAVPHARGVNNHMGSRATADRRVMTDVMRALPDGMYFIDSRTGGGSVAAAVAREMNVKTAVRHVFLDGVKTEAGVRRQLAALSSAARAKGIAIGIGHPHEVTLRVLAAEVPKLRARGFRFARASEVVR